MTKETKTIKIDVYPNREKIIRKDSIKGIYEQHNFITGKPDTFFVIEDYDGEVRGYITHTTPAEFAEKLKG